VSNTSERRYNGKVGNIDIISVFDGKIGRVDTLKPLMGGVVELTITRYTVYDISGY